MTEMIENRMVVDSEWELLEKNIPEEVREKLKEPGYHQMGTGNFVPESEAYEYALEQCLHGSEEDIKEFKEMLIEWYFSGNWVKEVGVVHQNVLDNVAFQVLQASEDA